MAHRQLSVEEREEIQRGLWNKESIRSIAKRLGRAHSSIVREINRTIPLKRSYKPRVAHIRALEKRRNRGRTLRLKNGFIRRYVVDHLKEGYSPEQIAGRLSLEHPKESVSHEAIYQYIYSQVYRNGNGTMKPGYHDLRPYLKRRHKKRAKKGMRKGQRIWRAEGPSIHERPEAANARLRLGDWESDTIAGKENGLGLNSLVDRKSGLLLLSRLSAKTAEATKSVIRERLTDLPSHTITADRGSENQYWQELQKETGASVYLADPYCAWQKGTNENTNGLVRWYFPKGTDFNHISDEAIANVEYALNTRPRKRLGWKTPLEVWGGAITG